MQIYNENGFDLLDANFNSDNLKDLPHVRMFENDGG